MPATATEAAIGAYRGYRASVLFDIELHDRQGRELSQVKDVVVDIANGEVRHAVLEVGGILGIGDREVTAPLDAIQGPFDRQVVMLDAAQLRALPDATQRPVGGALFRARQLVGREVIDRDGQRIGWLADLVIDMKRKRVHFAVLEFVPSFGPQNRLLAFRSSCSSPRRANG